MLELRDVGLSTDTGWALRVDQLRVTPGTLVIVGGSNGSGKTTLLRVMNLLLRPVSGALLYEGADVYRTRRAARRLRKQVVLVHQHPYLFDTGVFHNVAYGLRLRRLRGARLGRRVDEALAYVGLSGFGKRHARELSGGEVQRVAIARAIALRPRLLLLDEPTSATDAESSAAIAALMAEQPWAPDASVVATTHTLERLRQDADSAFFMEAGTLVPADEAARRGVRGDGPGYR